MSKIPCNEPRCPNNFHYSQTDLETIYKSMGLSTREGIINNNVINNTNNSFYSQDVESFSPTNMEMNRNTTNNEGIMRRFLGIFNR